MGSGGQASEWRRLGAVLAFPFLLGAAAPLSFTPGTAGHEPSVERYRAIWEKDGARIVGALEAATGVRFPGATIEAIVGDTPPMMAYDGRSMRLRAGYPEAIKRATLVHELGHAISFALRRTADLDDHRLLYLFLYDVWTDLYGRGFADRMVEIERRIPGPYDYDAAWSWALAMSREERQARLASLRVRLDYGEIDLGS